MKKTITYIRLSLGIIFIWYGFLKFFSQLSPAETLAVMTIDKLFFGLFSQEVSIKLLALWEVIIGFGLLLGVYLRFIIALFLLHMVLTFTPLFLLPELAFTQAPYAFTIVGQYIVKNIVFILAGVLIYQQEQAYRKASFLKN